MLSDTTYTLQKRSWAQHLNRNQIPATTHVQESSADRLDAQASALAHTDAMPIASMSASAHVQSPDMPATMAASPMTRKELPPVVIKANDGVKVFSMMHPGQRQHQVAQLKVHDLVLLLHRMADLTSAIVMFSNGCWALPFACIVHRG